MSRDEVLRKIKALFRLGDRQRNNSEAEAMAALEKARKLMAEYHIGMSEVETADKAAQKLDQKTGAGCSQEGRQDRAAFFGDAADVAIAAALYDVLLKCMRAAARQRYGSRWSTPHKLYCDGFADIVNQRARRRPQNLTPDQDQKYALVVASKQQWLQQALAEDPRTKDAPVRNTKPRHFDMRHTGAYMAGAAHGERVDLGTQRHLPARDVTDGVQLELSL